jgi:hypothetical protein
MPRVPSLRVRLATLVALVSLAVVADVGVALVRIVDQRMHDTVRGEAIRALERAKLSVAAGVSPNAISASQPGEPTIRVSDAQGSGNGSSATCSTTPPATPPAPSRSRSPRSTVTSS